MQLGGQAIDVIMVVTNEDGMQHLLHSKFKVGADASAAAGPVGRAGPGGVGLSICQTGKMLSSYTHSKRKRFTEHKKG